MILHMTPTRPTKGWFTLALGLNGRPVGFDLNQAPNHHSGSKQCKVVPDFRAKLHFTTLVSMNVKY